MFTTSQHAHFIGIGGIGMSGIAEILINLGMKVSGSDLRRGPVTDRLATLGATIFEGHEASHVGAATVANLGREHMDCYKDMADVERAFLDFMDKVPFYGAVTACVDDALLKGILPRARRRVFTYGIADEADYRIEFLAAGQDCYARFMVHSAEGPLGPFDLHVPGRHNVLNATAAAAIGHQLAVPADKIAEGLNRFRGVDRRFQRRGVARGITVVDDYGHHPTEIRATLAAARECGHKRIHVVFQPHRYTRTLDLLEEFGGSFKDADTLTVLPIYAASEEPIPGVTAEALVAKIEGPRTEFVPFFPAAVAAAVSMAGEGDLILTLGAGSVSQLGPLNLAELEKIS